MKFTVSGIGPLGNRETITWQDGKLISENPKNSQFAIGLAKALTGLSIGPPTQRVISGYLDQGAIAYVFLTEHYFKNVIEVTGDEELMEEVPEGAIP